MTHLVRVPDEVYRPLQSLAEELGTSLGAAVQHLVEQEEERRYWLQFAANFAALRADPVAWEEEVRGRSVWDGALMDGLHADPYEDERVTAQDDRNRDRDRHE